MDAAVNFTDPEVKVVKIAPDSICKAAHSTVVKITGSVVTFGIETDWPDVGTPVGVQLASVCHCELEDPFHVLS
jgi:hypothetical protein